MGIGLEQTWYQDQRRQRNFKIEFQLTTFMQATKVLRKINVK